MVTTRRRWPTVRLSGYVAIVRRQRGGGESLLAYPVSVGGVAFAVGRSPTYEITGVAPGLVAAYPLYRVRSENFAVAKGGVQSNQAVHARSGHFTSSGARLSTQHEIERYPLDQGEAG